MEYKHHLPSLKEIREKRPEIKRITRREAKVTFSPLERFAAFVTKRVGSMGFFFILFFWTIGWLGWNLYAPAGLHFDPAPAFVIWIFISNMIQVFLMPLIMVGQNLEGKFADQRAQADYEVNKKAEQEIEVVLAHLENQNEMLLELVKKIDRR